MEPARYSHEIQRLRDAGWSCVWPDQSSELPAEMHARYPWLPEDWLEFVSGLEECASADETRWILAPGDFDARQHKAFPHDEWERLGIDAANGDVELLRDIRSFWDGHIPIFFDVSDGYSFHAIRVFDHSGLVVTGRGPEFEDVMVSASDFAAFLARLS